MKQKSGNGGADIMNTKIEKLLNGKGGNYIFPFFWQHGETEEVLREYMKVIDESNIKAVCVESRPHPDFCGEKWWQDMDVILDEARKRNMKVWILDDSHFPTGFANGAMTDQPDELCRQSICCRIYDMRPGAEQAVNTENQPDGAADSCSEHASTKALHISSQELLHPDPFQKSMIETYVMRDEQRAFDDDRLLGLWAVRLDGHVSGQTEEAGGTEAGKTADGFRNENSAARINLLPMIKDGELNWEIPEGNWKVYALHLTRNYGYHRSYINMMDKTSCRVLIDAVYEPHYAHYKDDFGTTIAGFFSDEPELGNGHLYEVNDPFGTKGMDHPWSRELEEKLQKKLGDEYSLQMALLWEQEADPTATARARYAFMDAVTELVKEDFSMQLGEWCRERGVMYIGHLIEDDNHHTRTGSSLGHYFRGLWGQDMSGIDDIGGQVFPQGEDVSYNNGTFQHRNGEFYHYMLGKLGSSAAAIEPRKNGNSMCEIFGNYGWSEGVRLEKYLADHFLVRGINHYVPHAFSPKEFPDPDCPPHFYAHGHNPQYRHFGYLMAYMNRVCSLISDGHHAAPAAILYHAEGDWTGKCMTADKIGHLLADAQIEYDYIPQDVFAHPEDFKTQIRDQALQVNPQEYRVVIVPYMQFVTKAFAEAVKELSSHHVPVIFVGGLPEGLCDMPEDEAAADNREKSQEETLATQERIQEIFQKYGEIATPDELVTVLRKKGIPELTISPADNRIRYIHYIHEDGSSMWMFVNEGREVYRGKVTLPASDYSDRRLVLYGYDAWTNCIEPVKREGNTLFLEIEPLKSRIFIADPAASAEETAKFQKKNIWDGSDTEAEKTGADFQKQDPAFKKQQLAMKSGWRRSICSSKAYPAFAEEKEVILPDRLAEEMPEFSGFVRYENTLEASADDCIYLEITDAYEGVEVFVNERSLGIQIVPVYRYDLTGHLRDGENRIRIEVATTLEREMAKIPDRFGRKSEVKGLSGITGDVRVWKVTVSQPI